jgi:hypothetical protein
MPVFSGDGVTALTHSTRARFSGEEVTMPERGPGVRMRERF